jgi:hypothetical protein
MDMDGTELNQAGSLSAWSVSSFVVFIATIL